MLCTYIEISLQNSDLILNKANNDCAFSDKRYYCFKCGNRHLSTDIHRMRGRMFYFCNQPGCPTGGRRRFWAPKNQSRQRQAGMPRRVSSQAETFSSGSHDEIAHPIERQGTGVYRQKQASRSSQDPGVHYPTQNKHENQAEHQRRSHQKKAKHARRKYSRLVGGCVTFKPDCGRIMVFLVART